MKDAHLARRAGKNPNPTPGKPPRRLYRLNEAGLAQARALIAEH